MRIAINALLFAAGNMGGVEVYLRNLLTSLHQLDQQNEYVVLVSEKAAGTLQLPGNNFHEVVISVPTGRLAFVRQRVVNKLRRSLLNISDQTPLREQWLAKQISNLDVDLVHYPFSYIFPPVNNSRPAVLTFWDMQHEVYPQFFTEYEIQLRRRLYEPSAHRADHIIVPSRYTLDTLIQRYGIHPDKISLINFGVGSNFPRSVTPAQVMQLRQKYELHTPIIIYPAATYPHKNHVNLIEAFKRLINQVPDIQLVLTGAKMTRESELVDSINASGVGHRIKRLGFLPAREIPILYATAELLVFPSLFEGYGIPVIEAMHIGCPVVCSNACSLPELVGSAALLFEPTDVDAMTNSMLSVLTDSQLAGKLVSLGKQQAGKFSWQQAAQRTLGVYQAVV